MEPDAEEGCVPVEADDEPDEEPATAEEEGEGGDGEEEGGGAVAVGMTGTLDDRELKVFAKGSR